MAPIKRHVSFTSPLERESPPAPSSQSQSPKPQDISLSSEEETNLPGRPCLSLIEQVHIFNHLVASAPKGIYVQLYNGLPSLSENDKIFEDDFAVIRALTETLGQHRYWIFDVEDIYCRGCVEGFKAQQTMPVSLVPFL